MENNAIEPGPLHRLIPMMPLIREHAQHGGRKDHDRGCSKTRGDEARQQELDRVHSKSRACSNHEVRKPGVWLSQQGRSPSKGCLEEDRSRQPPNTSSHSYKQTRNSGHATHPAPSKQELSKFLKLKEEVVKRPQGYIQEHAKHIACTLTPNHEAVKCLMAFGENALKYAAEVLATIEWGTQH